MEGLTWPLPQNSLCTILAFVNLVFQFSMVRLNSFYVILRCFLLSITVLSLPPTFAVLLNCSPCRSQGFSFSTVGSNPLSSQYSKRLPSYSTQLLISSCLQRMLDGFTIIQQKHRHEVYNLINKLQPLFYFYSKLQGIPGVWPKIPSHPPWKHRNSGCAGRYGQLRYFINHFSYNCAHTVAT